MIRMPAMRRAGKWGAVRRRTTIFLESKWNSCPDVTRIAFMHTLLFEWNLEGYSIVLVCESSCLVDCRILQVKSSSLMPSLSSCQVGLGLGVVSIDVAVAHVTAC